MRVVIIYVVIVSEPVCAESLRLENPVYILNHLISLQVPYCARICMSSPSISSICRYNLNYSTSSSELIVILILSPFCPICDSNQPKRLSECLSYFSINFYIARYDTCTTKLLPM